MGVVTKVALTGDKQVWDNCNALRKVIVDKLLKRAMRKATQPIEDSAKANCRVDLGILRDSIKTRMSSKGTQGTYLAAFIGPATNIRAPLIRHKTGLGLPFEIDIPTRRAHLEEFGHNIVNKQGKIVGYAPGHAFMRPAWDDQGGEIALYNFSDSMQDGIKEEVAKLPQGVAP